MQGVKIYTIQTAQGDTYQVSELQDGTITDINQTVTPIDTVGAVALSALAAVGLFVGGVAVSKISCGQIS